MGRILPRVEPSPVTRTSQCTASQRMAVGHVRDFSLLDFGMGWYYGLYRRGGANIQTRLVASIAVARYIWSAVAGRGLRSSISQSGIVTGDWAGARSVAAPPAYAGHQSRDCQRCGSSSSSR